LKINNLHNFDLTLAKAKELQLSLVDKLSIGNGPEIAGISLVAGCDVAFDKKENLALGAVVLLSYPKLEKIDVLTGSAPLRFPYIPGYLSFREIEVLLPLFRRLSSVPDVVFVDGQGIAHPRGIGFASHIGLFLGIPTVGCAKSRLVGKHDGVGPEKGNWKPLLFMGKSVGSVLRTKSNVKPMFISPGHLVGIDRARELALACTGKYRIPEPTRQADIEVAKYKKVRQDGD